MCMNKEEITELYSNQAGSLRAKGRYKDAERLATVLVTVCSFVFVWGSFYSRKFSVRNAHYLLSNAMDSSELENPRLIFA